MRGSLLALNALIIMAAGLFAAETAPTEELNLAEPAAAAFRRQEDVPRGRLETVTYESRSVGTTRRLTIYTPPGWTKDKPHPTLYLLHGIGGDENEWQRFASVDALFDNLIAAGKAKPMIVVMPNGRARQDDRAKGDLFAAAPAFAHFERDLIDDVIPNVERRYGAAAHKSQRALAGLSMGGGQTFNFGLTHLDKFAWIGGFSAAPNTRAPGDLVKDTAKVTQELNLLWISCGRRDSLFRVSRGLHEHLNQSGVPHVWLTDDYGHVPAHWRNSLYWFSQRLFR